MMNKTRTKAQIKQEIQQNLRNNFGKSPEEATKHQLYESAALVLRDVLAEKLLKRQEAHEAGEQKQVHYLCMEFLLGRSFRNNAFNLGLLKTLEEALEDLGAQLSDIIPEEDDPGLGNGGLGRLAACFMDAMATIGIAANGYSIRYENGIFKQKIIDGEQVELPDSWLSSGDVWQMESTDETREVRMGGSVHTYWQDGKLKVEHYGYDPILAVPYDMPVSGYGTDNVTKLRLWEARSPEKMDYGLFSEGQYLKAMEKNALAKVISMVLYPEDKHVEGQSLRLKQQYFLVSATIQDIFSKEKRKYGSLDGFDRRNILHINDTHPTLVIPEMMRILLDEEGYAWEPAWDMVSRSVAFTNHTVLAEALECWPVDLLRRLAPRVYMIIEEIDRRLVERISAFYPGETQKVQAMRILCDGRVRMANLAIAGSFSVNGVSRLHSDILKERVFHDFYQMEPGKFQNVTNGIAHRRWLCQANPALSAFLTQLLGDGFIRHPGRLRELRRYAGDAGVRKRLGEIKEENKRMLARYVQDTYGIALNPQAIFDVQVKRLHEYKRQLLNVMHIISMYQEIKQYGAGTVTPRVFFFGSKAAPGYAVAKRIIELICSVADMVNSDPEVGDTLKVVFLEDYKVTLAERIMPAADISEQISTAGKEASGTGNMKLMMNGAVTVGTLDGANVEICQEVGRENMFLFGMTAKEAEELERSAAYDPMKLYQTSPRIAGVLTQMAQGFPDGKQYGDLVNSLLQEGGGRADRYFLLQDFESYRSAQRLAAETYRDRDRWNGIALQNIAASGYFAADRAVYDYAQRIWKVKTEFIY